MQAEQTRGNWPRASESGPIMHSEFCFVTQSGHLRLKTDPLSGKPDIEPIYTFLKHDFVTGGLKSSRAWIGHRKAVGRRRRIDENDSQLGSAQYMGAIPMD